MRRWIVTSTLALASMSCGQESDPAPATVPSREPLRLSEERPDLVCSGPSLDAAAFFRVTAFENKNHVFDYVVLERLRAPDDESPEILGDFRTYRDITPPPPTDVRFRFLFSEPASGLLDHTVMLAEGGFTNQATTEVKEINANGSTVVASLTCVRMLQR